MRPSQQRVSCPPGAKEVAQEIGAFRREHPWDNLGAVIEATVTHDVPERAHCTRFRVRGAEDEPIEPGQDDGTGAHRAGLQGDDKRAAVQSPLATGCGSLAQGYELGVPGGVVGDLAYVAPTPDDRP